jgi:hypothetical protein
VNEAEAQQTAKTISSIAPWRAAADVLPSSTVAYRPPGS